MGPITQPGAAPYAEYSEPLDRERLKISFRELFKKDWDNIEAGIYKMPMETQKLPNPVKLWRQSRDYFVDSEKVARRKAAGHHSEVLNEDSLEGFPRYFLQNFHFQTDGWLSEESAERYDAQVETIFTGAAGAMRRLALPFIHQHLQGRSGNDHNFLDLGCGTGVFLEEVKRNWAGLNVTGLDLSPAYLGKARARLNRFGKVDFVQSAAEDTGRVSAAYDMISAVYLFHELPPKVRKLVLREVARLLRPGGLFFVGGYPSV